MCCSTTLARCSRQATRLVKAKKTMQTCGGEVGTKGVSTGQEGAEKWDYVVLWVLHSDGAYSFCMVLKTKRASRHMHLISEKHLIERLRYDPRVGGEGELPKEHTQSEVTEALRYAGRGHTGRDQVLKQVVERGEEATTSPEGLSYPKAKRRLERRWTRRSATDFRGAIDPLLSWRESNGRKKGRGGGECRGKLQVPKQGGRAEAKELHKTSVDELLIKITESEGLRVDAGVFDQEMK
ncbi:hypothetical protein BHE74_00009257 [Ensete ventricosum]|nr:hypothetical protein BHE74_00009257 [Ensete ventricosum]